MSSKTKIVNLTMKKVSCSIVLPGRVVKSLLRNIVYDDFPENSQAVAAPPQDIFPEESNTSQFRQNGPLYPESLTESGQVKALTDSEKVARRKIG